MLCLKASAVPQFEFQHFVRHVLAANAGPMLEQDGQYFSERWGYLSRAGLNDKSQFTRQIEKYAGDFHYSWHMNDESWDSMLQHWLDIRSFCHSCRHLHIKSQQFPSIHSLPGEMVM